MKTKELKEDKLKQVTGGVGSGGGGYFPGTTPSTPSKPSNPTETYTIPVKGEDTEHVDIG